MTKKRNNLLITFMIALIPLGGFTIWGGYTFWSDRAPILEYCMTADTTLNRFSDALSINMQGYNRGSSDCWITLKLTVVNATITNASLPGFGFHESQSVIENNGQEVIISGRLVRAHTEKYIDIGQAYVKPIDEASTFTVTYTVDIPFNWNYPLGIDPIGAGSNPLTYVSQPSGGYSKLI